jgi:hypothetical protein
MTCVSGPHIGSAGAEGLSGRAGTEAAAPVPDERQEFGPVYILPFVIHMFKIVEAKKE